jgi:hypothetical protein
LAGIKAAKKAAKKKPLKKKAQPSSSPRQSPLPEPVEPNRPPAMASQEDEGLLGGIANMFQSKSKPAPESPKPSSGSSAEPLSAEAERLLNSVPDHIGSDGEVSGPSGQAGQIAAMIDGLVFKPEHVEVALRGIFKGLGWFFDSDHWELTPEDGGWITEPATQILNYIWLDNRDDISNAFVQWVMSTPGALGLLIGGGVVLGPRISKQMSLSRERRKQPLVADPKPAPQPIRPAAPAPKPRAGIVIEDAQPMRAAHVPMGAAFLDPDDGD